MIADQLSTLAGKAPARLLHRPQSGRVRQHGGPCLAPRNASDAHRGEVTHGARGNEW